MHGKKQVGLVGVKAIGSTGGKPSAAQLEKINQYTLDPMTADQVITRSFYMAHNAMDRDGECFNEPLLANFAKTMPGKGMFVKHPMSYDGDSGPGMGIWYDAEVMKMSFAEARQALKEPDLQWPPMAKDAQILVSHGYMPLTDGNKDLRTNISAGVAGKCSIGFNANDRIKVMDVEGNLMGYQWTAPGEALEGSLVWLGAQPGAAAFKGAVRPQNENQTEETDMELKEATERLTKAEARILALEIIEKSYKAVSDAVGGELAGNPVALKRAVEDGQGGRTALIDEIVGYERGFKQVGDGKDEVAAAKALYADMPLKNLMGLRDRYKAQKAALPGAAGGDIEGGDVSTTGAGEGAAGDAGTTVIDPKTGKNKGAGTGEKSKTMPDIEANPLLSPA